MPLFTRVRDVFAAVAVVNCSLSPCGNQFIPFGLLLQQADDDVVRAAFKRLTRPAKGSIYTPSELVVLLNQFDYTAAGLPTKRLTRALSLCLDNKVIDTHLFAPFVWRVCRDTMCPLFDHLRPIRRVKRFDVFAGRMLLCVCCMSQFCHGFPLCGTCD